MGLRLGECVQGVCHPNVSRVPPPLGVGRNWHAKDLSKNDTTTNKK